MRVFVDTNIYKFAAVKHHVYVPEKSKINWGGQEFEAIWHKPYTKNSILKIKNNLQRKDAVFLPILAHAGIIGHIKFIDSVEILMESAGLPGMASASGKFFGCPVERVKTPVDSTRVWLGGGRSADEWANSFVKAIHHPRYLELCKLTGAYQGQDCPLNLNQALDALHIWTAEAAYADAFLTMDYKLIKMIQNGRKKRVSLKAVSPGELLKDLLYSLGLIGSVSFLAKSFRFAKGHVKFDEEDGWH